MLVVGERLDFAAEDGAELGQRVGVAENGQVADAAGRHDPAAGVGVDIDGDADQGGLGGGRQGVGDPGEEPVVIPFGMNGAGGRAEQLLGGRAGWSGHPEIYPTAAGIRRAALVGWPASLVMSPWGERRAEQS